jgi:hypothetical protein
MSSKPVFKLSVSKLPSKKYAVSYINPKTNRVNTIQFGAKGYDDYITSGGDREKRRLYLIRHKNDNINDITTAGFWAHHLLWSRPTLAGAMANIEQMFNIDIRRE